jgi:mono/diheme cytochrome c family protein
MKKYLIFALLAGIVIACGNSSSTAESVEKTAQTQEDDGSKLYKTYCITCHGLYGDMGASGAANLAQSKLNLQERIEVVKNGRNTMTGFSTLLSDDKIELVAKYTMTLTKEN